MVDYFSLEYWTTPSSIVFLAGAAMGAFILYALLAPPTLQTQGTVY